jgi:hypothetical protein
VEPINALSLDSAATAAVNASADRSPIERRRRLSPAALAVTNRKVSGAYSPIVIAGAVRVVDFVMLSAIGIALYFGYVVPRSGFYWEYFAAIFGMTAAAVICFQAADIYQVQVFRGQLRQMTRMISSWALVFLLFIGASFIIKRGGDVSRLWLTSFFFVGLAALVTERVMLRSLVRSWARQGRLDRRTIVVGADQNGEQLVQALKTQDDSDIEVLGVFDDRNDDRAMDTCAGSPKLGKVDDIVEFARRTRVDLVLFALPISAETRILEIEEAVGAAGGYPPFGPYQQAALPPPLLFLSRRGADARRVRGADHRLGSGNEVAVRPRRRLPDHGAGAAGDGAGRARGQARQPGPRAVPPEAVRLQQ